MTAVEKPTCSLPALECAAGDEPEAGAALDGELLLVEPVALGTELFPAGAVTTSEGEAAEPDATPLGAAPLLIVVPPVPPLMVVPPGGIESVLPGGRVTLPLGPGVGTLAEAEPLPDVPVGPGAPGASSVREGTDIPA